MQLAVWLVYMCNSMCGVCVYVCVIVLFALLLNCQAKKKQAKLAKKKGTKADADDVSVIYL